MNLRFVPRKEYLTIDGQVVPKESNFAATSRTVKVLQYRDTERYWFNNGVKEYFWIDIPTVESET